MMFIAVRKPLADDFEMSIAPRLWKLRKADLKLGAFVTIAF